MITVVLVIVHANLIIFHVIQRLLSSLVSTFYIYMITVVLVIVHANLIIFIIRSHAFLILIIIAIISVVV